jgi:hypothetical protein
MSIIYRNIFMTGLLHFLCVTGTVISEKLWEALCLPVGGKAYLPQTRGRKPPRISNKLLTFRRP